MKSYIGLMNRCRQLGWTNNTLSKVMILSIIGIFKCYTVLVFGTFLICCIISYTRVNFFFFIMRRNSFYNI